MDMGSVWSVLVGGTSTGSVRRYKAQPAAVVCPGELVRIPPRFQRSENLPPNAPNNENNAQASSFPIVSASSLSAIGHSYYLPSGSSR